MSQHDFVISNQTFPATRSDMNNAFQALASTSQGTTAPSTIYAYQFWLDTNATPWLLKMRNAANDAWITIMRVEDSDNSASIDAANVDLLDSAGHFVGTELEAALAELGPFTVPSIVAGDVFYGSAGDTVARLAKGTDGESLMLASGIPAWGSSLTVETPIATTSGTVHSFTGIRAGANRVTFMLNGVSLSGTNQMHIRLGDSGGFETSGYESRASSGTSETQITTAFIISRAGITGDLWSGAIIFVKEKDHVWVSNGNLNKDAASVSIQISSGQSPSGMGELTQIQIKSGSSDTFDAGEVNILIE